MPYSENILAFASPAGSHLLSQKPHLSFSFILQLRAKKGVWQGHLIEISSERCRPRHLIGVLQQTERMITGPRNIVLVVWALLGTRFLVAIVNVDLETAVELWMRERESMLSEKQCTIKTIKNKKK